MAQNEVLQQTSGSSDGSSGDGGILQAARQRRQPRTAISMVLATLLLVNLAMSLYQLPLNRVVERRLCRDYYVDHDPTQIGRDGIVEEHLCKIDAVQKSLGSIQGVMETIWIVGDFFMTIPLGFVAQAKGRRLVLVLNLASRVFMLSWAVIVGYFDLMLPTKAIIVGPILSVLGGDCVFNSIMYALASDLTDDPVRRATYFGYMSSVSYVVALLGPAMASLTMSILLWLPFFVGIIVLMLAVWTISRLPSGRDTSASSSSDEEQRQGLLSSPILKAHDSQRGQSIASSAIGHVGVLLQVITSHPRNFSLLLFSFFLTSLASSDTKMLVQYISGRYEWSFASAGYLLSGKAVVNFILLTLIVPRFLKTQDFSKSDNVDRTNITYAKYCLIISVIGALGIAVAIGMWILVPSLLIYAVGSALPIFTLSLLKSPAICPQSRDPDDGQPGADNHIFSIVMLVKTLGSLLGAPLMAALWVSGIGVGGLALGMPFFVSSACYVAAIIVFSSIDIR